MSNNRINRPNNTGISNSTLKKVSELRRGQIIESTVKKEEEALSKYAATDIVHNPNYGLKKRANAGPVTLPSVNQSTERLAPDVYSPLFLLSNLNLPRDRVTLNAWNRIYYDTNPIVRNAINLHASYPISKINITCKDKKIQQFFEEMCESIDLYNAVYGLASEYWKLGEKVDGNSIITMADGTVKLIKDIKIGDYVLTHLGNKKKVIDTFKKPTNKVIEDHLNVYKIKSTGSLNELIISGKHPVFAIKSKDILCTNTQDCINKSMRIKPGIKKCSNCGKQNEKIDIQPDFIETYSLEVNDIVCQPFNTDIIENDIFTPELCYIIGYWLAEGCFCKDKRKNNDTVYTGIKFCSYDGDFLKEKFIPLFENVVKESGALYISKGTHNGPGFKIADENLKKDKFDYWFSGLKKGAGNLAKFFQEHCGEYSKNKKLSETIMQLPPNLQSYILAGFIDGDGCVTTSAGLKGRTIINTSSLDLFNQFSLIVKRLGISPNLSMQVSKYSGEPLYRLEIKSNQAYSILKGKLLSFKNDLLTETKFTANRSLIYKNWNLINILEKNDITDIYNEPYMYDIEVEDDHSYIANGIAIHNCFPYAELDNRTGMWKKITILNPDYITVDRAIIGEQTIISLRPDSALQRLVNSSNPKDLFLKRRIPGYIIDYVRKGQNIPLDSFNISHLKYLSSPYDYRGTSVIVACYKDLILYDKYRESKYVQADGMVNPLTLITLGGGANPDYRPTASDIQAVKSIFEEAQWDKDYKIITHDGIKVERVGYSGATLDIAADLELIINNLYAGLMVPKALIEQESACLKSSDNELLSERGWIKFAELQEDDKIATLNPENDALEFHKPVFKTEYEFTGMMYNFKNVDVDVEVTDFHEMYVSNKSDKNGFHKVRALNVFNINDINSETNFNSKYKGNVRFKTSIKNWEGTAVDSVSIPYNEHYSKEISYKVIPIDDWIEFIGYYLSEGHLRRRQKKYNYMPCAVEITQLPKSKGYEKMQALFNRMPYHISLVGAKNNRNTWNITNKKLAEFVLSECGERSDGKYIPTWMKNLPQEKLKLLLYSMMLGDGYFNVTGSSGSGYYHTVSKQLANDVQEIALKCGYVSKITTGDKPNKKPHHKTWYRVVIIRNEKALKGTERRSQPVVKPNHTSINWVDKEKVFCVEVPNHLFITRHNGKIAIHGNTYASSSIGLEVLRQRYDIFRNMVKKWLERKIFAPISELQEFVEYVNGEKRLVVPNIDFNHMNLWDMNDYIQSISNFVGERQVSRQTLYRTLGLSYEEEETRLREEMIADAVKKKEMLALDTMRLSELRALDPESPIPEPLEPEQMSEVNGLPGVGGEEGMPGGGLEGLMGGGPEAGGMPTGPAGPGPGPEPPNSPANPSGPAGASPPPAGGPKPA